MSGKINLLPKDQFEYSQAGKFIKWSISVGRWIVVLTEFIVICAFLSRFYFDTQLANLFDDIKQKKAIVASAATFEENFRNTQEKIKIIKDLLADEQKPSSFIKAVSQSLPLEVTLTKVVIEEGELTVSGYSFSENSLKVFLNELSKKPDFTSVNLREIASRPDNQPGIEFSVIATYKGDSRK
jgi:Tfp pilus assembly protein PilN